MNKNLSIKDLGINKLDSDLTEYVFDGLKESSNSISLVIDNSENVNLIFINLNDGFSCDLLLEKNTNVNLSIFLKNPKNTVNFSAKLKQNAYLNAYCADFSKDKNDSNFLVDLDEENSSCDWHLASLSSNNDNKSISVSINHNAPNTNASVENYGVCKDDSHLIFSGTSFIIKGSHGCKTRQSSKIMVFDAKSDAVAKPILKIDENDVEASHAAVVGKINDEHMFYLTSRGLSVNDARSLITMGYLKPILKGFFNEKYRNEILNLIEGKL